MHAAVRRASSFIAVSRHGLSLRSLSTAASQVKALPTVTEPTAHAHPIASPTDPAASTPISRAIHKESNYIPGSLESSAGHIIRLRSYMTTYQASKLAQKFPLSKVLNIVKAISSLEDGHHLKKAVKEELLESVQESEGGPHDVFLIIAVYMLAAAGRERFRASRNKQLINELLRVAWDGGSEKGKLLAGCLLLKPMPTLQKDVKATFVTNEEALDIYHKLCAINHHAVHEAYAKFLYNEWLRTSEGWVERRSMLVEQLIAELEKAYELCEDSRTRSMAAQDLGMHYALGKLVPQDGPKAMQWLDAALVDAHKAHGIAARLATIHMGRWTHGDPSIFNPDPTKVLQYLEIAAPRNPWAAYEAGKRYYLDPVEKPYELSVSEHVERYHVGPDDRRAAMYFYYGFALSDVNCRIKLAEMLFFQRVDPSALPKSWKRKTDTETDSPMPQTWSSNKFLPSTDIEDPPLPVFLDPHWAMNFALKLVQPLYDPKRQCWPDQIAPNSPIRYLPAEKLPAAKGSKSKRSRGAEPNAWEQVAVGLAAQGKVPLDVLSRRKGSEPKSSPSEKESSVEPLLDPRQEKSAVGNWIRSLARRQHYQAQLNSTKAAPDDTVVTDAKAKMGDSTREGGASEGITSDSIKVVPGDAAVTNGKATADDATGGAETSDQEKDIDAHPSSKEENATVDKTPMAPPSERSKSDEGKHIDTDPSNALSEEEKVQGQETPTLPAAEYIPLDWAQADFSKVLRPKKERTLTEQLVWQRKFRNAHGPGLVERADSDVQDEVQKGRDEDVCDGLYKDEPPSNGG